MAQSVPVSPDLSPVQLDFTLRPGFLVTGRVTTSDGEGIAGAWVRPLRSGEQLPQATRSVLAVTDHLTGDDRLVNHAVHFTDPQGILYLSHIEDEADFERYLEVISKIPTIDTENAQEAIGQQLLKEPQDYIDSCRAALHESGLTLQIESSVLMGHRISDYKRLIQEHSIDLLVLNTKDEEQFAMHGLAYPLAVELRQVPMLML